MPSDLEDCAYTSPSVTRTDTGDWASLKPMPLLGTLDDTTSWSASGPSTDVSTAGCVVPARLSSTMKGQRVAEGELGAARTPGAALEVLELQGPGTRCAGRSGPCAPVMVNSLPENTVPGTLGAVFRASAGVAAATRTTPAASATRRQIVAARRSHPAEAPHGHPLVRRRQTRRSDLFALVVIQERAYSLGKLTQPDCTGGACLGPGPPAALEERRRPG